MYPCYRCREFLLSARCGAVRRCCLGLYSGPMFSVYSFRARGPRCLFFSFFFFFSDAGVLLCAAVCFVFSWLYVRFGRISQVIWFRLCCSCGVFSTPVCSSPSVILIRALQDWAVRCPIVGAQTLPWGPVADVVLFLARVCLLLEWMFARVLGSKLFVRCFTSVKAIFSLQLVSCYIPGVMRAASGWARWRPTSLYRVVTVWLRGWVLVRQLIEIFGLMFLSCFFCCVCSFFARGF